MSNPAPIVAATDVGAVAALALAQRAEAVITLEEAVRWLALPPWVPKGHIALQRLLHGLDAELIGGTQFPAVPGLGDHPIRTIRRGDIRALGRAVAERVGHAKVAHAQETRTTLPSYRFDDHGHGAHRTFLEVVSRMFTEAVHEGLVHANPLQGVPTPAPREDRRPLSEEEMEDLHRWIGMRCKDPVLDHLLIDTFVWTGVRREGILGLTLDSLDPRRHAVGVYQKNAKPQRVPLSTPRIEAIRALALARGAVAGSDHVFRRSNGVPVTSRHLDNLFDKLKRDHVFPSHTPVTTHWLRHTSLDRIEKTTDDPVILAYWLNHSLASLGTTARYLQAPTFQQLCDAAERAFGPLTTAAAPHMPQLFGATVPSPTATSVLTAYAPLAPAQQDPQGQSGAPDLRHPSQRRPTGGRSATATRTAISVAAHTKGADAAALAAALAVSAPGPLSPRVARLRAGSRNRKAPQLGTPAAPRTAPAPPMLFLAPRSGRTMEEPTTEGHDDD